MSNVVKTHGTEPNNATTSNTFGKSMESQAQIQDAAEIPTPKIGDGEKLNIYKLLPIAEQDDPRWANSPYQGEVVVAARTSGDARIVASAHERDFMKIDAAPAEDVTTSNASAFRSEKLYTVIQIDRDRDDLTRGVLAGSIFADTIEPSEE
ncbi:hypothetical protein [Rhizobium tumorigenes]|uniref:Uncharacterized protein n=1 Tax=Rhizobium tumorigenes TaxID=2041385 RepID=A0AAF1KJB8_9HYPH|nr:hypothetical protein [Rhizobium tumorigenes]WFR97491.1 hypothetical protein PR017_19925 [Rhizobium tumorigenes]